MDGSIHELSLATAPHNLLVIEKGIYKDGHSFNMCVCDPLVVSKRVQSGVDTSPNAKILATTATFRHNARRTKF